VNLSTRYIELDKTWQDKALQGKARQGKAHNPIYREGFLHVVGLSPFLFVAAIPSTVKDSFI
jgi:hypothetical protein